MDLEVIPATENVLVQLATAINSAKNRNDRLTVVNEVVSFKYDLLRVNNTGKFYYKQKNENTYELLDDHTLENIVRNVYLWQKVRFTPSELTDATDMVKILTMNEVEEVKLDWIEVTPNKYWDVKNGCLRNKPTSPCFHRLFNTKFEDKHVVKVPQFTEEQEAQMMETYESTISYMEAHDGDLEETFPFITTWADHVHDVYMDMIRAIGYCFLYKKPVGAYILIGLRRNGKSTYIGMLHTIFGRENSAVVRLSQMGDPHFVNTLSNAIINAPDEEDEKPMDAQANFKTMADHGMLTLSKMHSNEPLNVVCDFMGFYAQNHSPEWKGSGAAACMKRSLVIPFEADLSRFDSTTSNFAEDTFTADTMSKLMGTVLGIATYHTSHPLKFSKTMLDTMDSMEDEVDSAVKYLAQFEMFFDGFQTYDLLYKDYQNWCKSNDFPIRTMKELKFVFRKYKSSRESIRTGDVVTKTYRIAKPNKLPMLQNDYYKELRNSLMTLHEIGNSVVYNKYVQVEEKVR